MAYTPTTWVTGDTITAVKLNNMEQGIADAGIFLVETEWDDAKGGIEILTPLADIATATADGRICMTTGCFSDCKISVVSAPWGGYFVSCPPQIAIETGYTPPLLVYTTYDWDSEQSVLIESTVNYTLTPAT